MSENYTFLPAEDKSERAAQEIVPAFLPWLERFCAKHEFVSRSGYTAVSRALNLAMGINPRTKKEKAFLDALLAEVERRFPGDSYPKGCIRRGPRGSQLLH